MPTGGPQFGQPSNQKLEDEQETNFKSQMEMPSGGLQLSKLEDEKETNFKSQMVCGECHLVDCSSASLNQEEEDGNAIWWTTVQQV